MSIFARRRSLRLRHHASLKPPRDDLVLAAVSAGPAHTAVSVWTSREDLKTLRPNLEQPYAPNSKCSSVVLSTQTPKLDTLTRTSGVFPAYPLVQPLPDGRFLWVGSRAAWREGDAEANGLAINADGEVALAVCVGDGVKHAQTSADGDTWLGFADDGIFGNMGWAGPGPTPLGAAGVVSYSAALEPRWRFPGQTPAALAIDDCYALNVADDATWAYYYSDFPIVRIANGEIQTWRTQVSGAKALITDGACAALIGGYRGDRDRIVLGRLDEEFTELAEAALIMPNGCPVPSHAVTQGRVDQLHVFVDQEWFRADLSQLL